MNRTSVARAALNIGTTLVTLAGTGAAVLLLSGDVQATGTGRTVWLAVLAVVAFLAVDRLVEVAAAPLVDRLYPRTLTVTCGTDGCPVEIEISGCLHVEDDDRLVQLATDHTRHPAA